MLDHERDEQRNIDKLNQYYLESLPLLQEKLLYLADRRKGTAG